MRNDRHTARFGSAQRETSLTSTSREMMPLFARVYTFTVQAANTVDCYLPDPDTLGLEYGMRVVLVNRGIGGTGDLRLWLHDADLGDLVRDFANGTWEASGSSTDFTLTPGYMAIAKLGIGPFNQKEWVIVRKTALGRTIL